jgi:uncharacterized protein YdeI (YjbR/CyaY-like superfamily)
VAEELEGGVVHAMPADLRDAIAAVPAVREVWATLTPLARNEWICWVEDAKRAETRAKRILVGIDKLTSGMRRPCCWPGCGHREGKKVFERKRARGG